MEGAWWVIPPGPPCPRCAGSLSMRMSPPWARAILRAMAMPSPVPRSLVEMLATTAIIQPLSPEQARGAELFVTSHTYKAFEVSDDPLPAPAFLGPFLSAEDVPGDLRGTLDTFDRAVTVPTPDPFVFKLNSTLRPDFGAGVFEGVRSTPRSPSTELLRS